MNQLKYDEISSIRAFWNWLKEEKLAEEELAQIKSQEDPPDFQFTHEGKSVAVEHTQVFRPTGEESLLPLHDTEIQVRICNRLNAFLEHRDSQIKNVFISINFGSCQTVKKKDEQVIARGIFNLVSERLGKGDALPIELFMCDLSEINPCLEYVLVMDGGASSEVAGHAFGRVDEWGLGRFGEAERERKRRNYLATKPNSTNAGYF